MSQAAVNVLPHTALAAVNTGARIKIYFQGETGGLYELSTEDDRVYVCNEVVIPKRLDGARVPRMFTPLAACSYDEGNEVRLYYLDEDSIIRELCWTMGHNGGMWYLGDLQLGAQRIMAAHYSDLAVVYFGGKFRLYYQTPKDNSIVEVCKNKNDLWVKGSTLHATATPGTRLAATVSAGNEELVNIYYQDKTLHPCVVIITPKETTVDTRRTSEIHLPHRAPLATLNHRMHTHDTLTSINVYTQLQDNLIGKLSRSSEDTDLEFDILGECGPLTSLAVVSGVTVDDDWVDGLRVFFLYQDGRMVSSGRESAVVVGKKAWSEVEEWMVEKRVTPVWPRGDWEGNLEWDGVDLDLGMKGEQE
ncbi:hypothetical protein L211DRAFT_865549 [Terfezia boudieri ATCC MYA-4762]|uniref:Uncharacterized protein n=1 Tax=Terfezia boudieri ATCC MYA-4762 TaxID=1051890 RepID=A0A3N4M1R2_9PEZI|nr:hypothetical protein L211DRAFT_865549 [Terfezia boudieri ATCC MYA-4762]